ncbi:hypothetical protein ACFXDH_21510 [Streptomyces sp. NPDC059467]|uniref:hypothetical protein n=1 Tax=Streptomyces sp. NPDC059467 TaxID=3346844 RepID=UPI0036829F67
MKPRGREPSGGEAAQPVADTSEQQVSAVHTTYTTVHQNMYGPIGPGGVTAVTGAAPIAQGRATGPMREEEISLLLRRYTEPAVFPEALAALEADRVVALIGAAGTGKRSGAVALLKTVVHDKGRMIVLSPDITLEQLAERRFDSGNGYVVLDRVDEGGIRDAQADFAWRRVQERIHACKAHLVITTRPRADRTPPSSVRHVAWEAPATEKVLRLRLKLGGCSDAKVARAVELIRPNCPVAKAVEVADGICRGGEPEEVWKEYDSNTYETVQRWFNAPGRTMREILQVTTVAFAAGNGIRTCEQLLTLLDHHLSREFGSLNGSRGRGSGLSSSLTAPTAMGATSVTVGKGKDLAAKQSGTGDAVLLDHRRAMLGIDLLTTVRIPVDSVTREVVVFGTPSHRRWVLTELWARYPAEFWDAVQKWLTAVVSEPDAPCPPGTLAGAQLEVSMAAALAMLAATDFEEVADRYLLPWAAGQAGQRGQAMAVYVLWDMCQNDLGLDTAALAIARSWTQSRSAALRDTAALAFSGWLGVRFPTDAVKWLWHLIVHEGIEGMGTAALARFFALLVYQDEDPSRILGLLTYRLGKHASQAGRSPLKSLTFGAVVTILSIRDASNRPIALRYFALHSDRCDQLLQLWAAAFSYWPMRERTVAAFASHLRALPQLTEKPADVSRALGRGLRVRLGEVDRAALRADLVRLTRRKGPGDAIGPLLEEL